MVPLGQSNKIFSFSVPNLGILSHMHPHFDFIFFVCFNASIHDFNMDTSFPGHFIRLNFYACINFFCKWLIVPNSPTAKLVGVCLNLEFDEHI